MAGVSTPRLAAAVSNAGGLGALGIGASTAAQARAMIEETFALTDRPSTSTSSATPGAGRPGRRCRLAGPPGPRFQALGLTPPTQLREIYRSFVQADDVFALLLELRPAVVSFHFGLPAPAWIAALRQAGIVTLATATCPAEARQIEAAGVDAIVAQGIEAGGHRGMFDPSAPDERLSTLVLLQRLRRETRLLIAAGGLMDGAGIRAALALGAVAAQLGTAFVLCPESAADAAYRAALQGERAEHTRLTACCPAARPAGCWPLHRRRRTAPAGRAGGLPAGLRRHQAAACRRQPRGPQRRRHRYAAHWAGQGAPLARALPAAALIDTLVAEMAQPARPEAGPGSGLGLGHHGGQLGQRTRLHLQHDGGAVGLHRLDRQLQLVGDDLVELARQDAVQHLALAPAQAGQALADGALPALPGQGLLRDRMAAPTMSSRYCSLKGFSMKS
jgi:nitronate monooxygenase